MDGIYRIFLTLAHLLYDLIQAAQFYYRNLQCRLVAFLYTNESLTQKTATIINDVRSFNKLPKHFALIIGTEEPSIADLVQILTWCLVTGIPYVTFYDNNGHLKREEEYIREEFLKSKPEFAQHIEWNPDLSMKTMKNGTNGIKHKTRIQCLSYEDGKGAIVVLTRNLAKGVKMGSVKLDEINLELLDNKLNPEKVPEPDLAIICGEKYCTFGFLPWHIRVTEFHWLPSHHNIQATEFVNVLKDYSLSEQRYGK